MAVDVEGKMGGVRGTVVAVCVSEKKGTTKENVGRARLIPDWGVEGDAHAGPWHRQVSLLAWESIEQMRARGLDVREGSFAENITTRGIELHTLPVGTRLPLVIKCGSVSLRTPSSVAQTSAVAVAMLPTKAAKMPTLAGARRCNTANTIAQPRAASICRQERRLPEVNLSPRPRL